MNLSNKENHGFQVVTAQQIYTDKYLYK